ncbi:prenyltransferase [Corynebacterium crudilactis]|uniref:Prenyltransferase n=1 Tax=Corynebacterium crudilactis TaxID=1652495 RepID=A0A172QRH9_9CORY|nr:prenyltransferase [Corynebacterium crudilactis]ANE03305.1 prenyltransferase [Corynebacterium crudilactis]
MIEKIRLILLSSRPISWVNTAYPFGLAYLLNGGDIDWLFWLGIIFFLIPYNIAMYGINDVFDYESDIRNPRKGGVEGAVLPKSSHSTLLWASAISTVPFLVILFIFGTWMSATWLTISALAVIAYSAPKLRFKERPFLDALTSSTHFTSPALVGATITGANLSTAMWIALGSFFLWGMASQILGAVQDVNADREAELSSIATVIGARGAIRFSVVLYLLAAVLATTLPNPAWIVGLAILTYVFNAARFWNITNETCEQANRSWKVFLWLNYFVGAVITILLMAIHQI